jgi:nicotinate-nucleotide pyrophosphorylase (carboxylating)
MGLNTLTAKDVIHRALQEDSGPGDITTDSIFGPRDISRGILLAKEEGIIAGLEIAQLVFQTLDDRVVFRARIADGASVTRGEVLGNIEGPTKAILTGERIALNFLQRLSGIATKTAGYVAAVAGTKARIVDTRKTVPGLRLLDKYAVQVGGGTNHRLGLYDAVLIKDNHIAAMGGIEAAVARVRARAPFTVKVEVEVQELRQVQEALQSRVEVIMLDNMSVPLMREAVAMINGQALVEASGGVTLANVQEVAATGVDLISVGELTHSVKALDLSLKLEP